MAEIVFVHDLPSDVPGKTWKQKNRDIVHNIPIGTLVEVDYKDAPNRGVRMFVCKHVRDCDNTPLYSLTWDMEMFNKYKDGPYEGAARDSGYSEESLKVIKPSDLDRAFQMLEAHGISRQRAVNVANGIDVLVTRYRKEIMCLKMEIADLKEKI